MTIEPNSSFPIFILKRLKNPLNNPRINRQQNANSLINHSIINLYRFLYSFGYFVDTSRRLKRHIFTVTFLRNFIEKREDRCSSVVACIFVYVFVFCVVDFRETYL